VVAVGLLALSAWGCAATADRGTIATTPADDYARLVPELTRQTVRKPDDPKAWARLGEAQYHAGQITEARESFDRALSLDDNLLPARLYVGYIAESQDSVDQALRHYAIYLDRKPGGKVAGEVARRLEALRRARAAAFARDALAHERELKPTRFSDSTIGVVYFNSERLPGPMQPLARGLAEMLVTDLSKVRALRVVERLKTERLLEELKLSHTAAFDTLTAPRLGKLLGAAHVLGGDAAQLSQGRLRFDPQLVSTKTGDVDLTKEQVGGTDQFFQMQKQIVFDVLKELDIEVTPDEKLAIGKVPTDNFAAFLAFSRGLEYQDLGMYSEAHREFQRAAAADPGFKAAGERAREVNPLSSGKPVDQPEKLEVFVATTSETTDLTAAPTTTEDRLDRLMQNSGFVPTAEPAGTTDNPFTPPSSSTLIIIHGHFDEEPR
jgi:tetratricopeptide (TPR) repeat protein